MTRQFLAGKRFLAFFGLFLWFSVGCADDALTARIDNHLKALHARFRFDGAVLVAKKDQILYKKAFGEADREWHAPNTPSTKFLVGSISKQFASMLVLQLAELGKIDLQAPISSYLSEFPKERGEKITVHHLLCHSSGLPHYAGIAHHGVDLDDYLRLYRPVGEYVKLIGELALEFEPGERYSYSSMGYIVLGYLVEKVTGKSFNRVLQEQICAPLGLKNTGFAYNNTLVEYLAKGYTYGYRKLDDGSVFIGYYHEDYRDQSNKFCTGGIYSTVADMYHWTKALFTDKLLSKPFRDKMFSPQSGDYGYGWRISPGEVWGIGDVEIIHHGGSLEGYKAYVAMINRGEYTIIALANTGQSYSTPAAENIAKIIYGQKTGPIDNAPPAIAKVMIRQGVAAGEKLYQQMKANGFEGYFHIDSIYNAEAYRLSGVGKVEEGLALLRMAADAFPKNANLYDSSGELYVLSGQPEKAVSFYKKAIEVAETYPKGNEGVVESSRKALEKLQK